LQKCKYSYCLTETLEMGSLYINVPCFYILQSKLLGI
jgi:hypothetical protein